LGGGIKLRIKFLFIGQVPKCNTFVPFIFIWLFIIYSWIITFRFQIITIYKENPLFILLTYSIVDLKPQKKINFFFFFMMCTVFCFSPLPPPQWKWEYWDSHNTSHGYIMFLLNNHFIEYSVLALWHAYYC